MLFRSLSTLAPERTHRLELSLENVPGSLVLLVTLTASLHVSIAEMSVTPLDDPQERAHIAQHYVRSGWSYASVGTHTFMSPNRTRTWVYWKTIGLMYVVTFLT